MGTSFMTQLLRCVEPEGNSEGVLCNAIEDAGQVSRKENHQFINVTLMLGL